MKAQKKLKRGLADLSNFFSEPIPAEQTKRPGRLLIEPPEISDSTELLKPSLNTASIFSFSPLFSLAELTRFTEAIKLTFSEIHYIKVRTGKHSVEYQIENKNIHYKKIDRNELETLIKPQMRSNTNQETSSGHKALAIFDSGLYASNVSHSDIRLSLLELLDHCIFALSSDTKLPQVYEVMKMALSRNPALHYSFLLVGNNAERLSEIIYERFSEIISHHLGHHLEFLGWMEHYRQCLNPDLLKEGADSAFVHYSKTHLNHWLYSVN